MANTNSILTVVNVVANGADSDTKSGFGGVNIHEFHGMLMSFVDELYGDENSMLMLAVDHFTKLKIPSL